MSTSAPDPEQQESAAARAERTLRSIVAHEGLYTGPESPGEAMAWALGTIETLRAGMPENPDGDRWDYLYDGGMGPLPARLVVGPEPANGSRVVVRMSTARVTAVNGAMVVARAPGTSTDVTTIEAHHPDQPGDAPTAWSSMELMVRDAVGVLVRGMNDPDMPDLTEPLETLRTLLNLDESGDPR